MTDDATDRWSKAEHVSIPAVVTPAGKDPVQALLEAGIVDPVRVPFNTDDAGQGGYSGLGDGITPNLQAVLEFTGAGPDEGDETNQPVPPTQSGPAALPDA